MLNKYPLWKNLLVIVAVLVAIIYALPNFYPDDYAVQISGQRSTTAVDNSVMKTATDALNQAHIAFHNPHLGKDSLTIRFKDADAQLKAKSVVQAALGDNYLVALNLAETTPAWLKSLGATPMKLGLDLRGGVHFLMQVDMDKAIQQKLDVYASEMKRRLREERIRYRGGNVQADNRIVLDFRNAAERDQAESYLKQHYNEFLFSQGQDGKLLTLTLALTEKAVRDIQDYAVEQNLTTLRNRVNELGVAEPLVQRQGRDRIVVELPGIQDTAQAKRILGATANLEFRLEAKADEPSSQTQVFTFRDNPSRSATLESDVIATGDNVSNAKQSFDENGRPEVNITLDAQGGEMMTRVTSHAVGRRMAVLYIETKMETHEKQVNGKTEIVHTRKTEKHIINLATIQSVLGSQFRITGLDSIQEASELALLLRAGSLAAPMYFVEERTVGPSLGKQNIDAGVKSALMGFAFVFLYMIFFYRFFGLVANIALLCNAALIVACMSILTATLTLPGIAGIVLTLGMAVDANVLIFERIKEELRAGLPPQSAINAGYSRAFVSIFDSNVTTLLAAIILFAVGTGPVKGFAVTLSIGIVTSMFTAITVCRAIVNAIYGGRRVEKLSI
ncbi:protein translocase subunit SecD [Mangrovitalea sediminis]|uniref:protein translocase subunit SecD n=1 Tax=Mangrovitalea sediminis TaxID=1982043 RepID=UPI000BE52740|nr:protein translocase subunit SecD [Mangrovitalea sediminis]